MALYAVMKITYIQAVLSLYLNTCMKIIPDFYRYTFLCMKKR